MIRKVGYIFDILDGVSNGSVQDVDTEICTLCLIADMDVNAVVTSLESLQEHILENSTFHLIY
jgi:hypothetical protein